jgi:hypothetical protein
MDNLRDIDKVIGEGLKSNELDEDETSLLEAELESLMNGLTVSEDVNKDIGTVPIALPLAPKSSIEIQNTNTNYDQMRIKELS